MAASSEIRFKIGADTSALSKAFVGAQSVAAAAGARIQKSFGLKDAMKGIFQGIGIGSVQSITDMIVAPFEAAAERARALVGLTASLSDNTNRWLSALGGPRRELELQVRQVNDLNTEISLQRQLVADLNANPLRFINAETRTAIKEAEAGLDALILKQAELATTAQMVALADNRRTEALQVQARDADYLSQMELAHATEANKLEEKRLQLVDRYNVRKAQGALPSELQENLNAQAAIVQQSKLAAQVRREKINDIERQINLQQKLSTLELKDAGERAKVLATLRSKRAEYDELKKRNGGEANSPELSQNRGEQLALKNQLALLNKQAREAQSGALSGLGQSLTGGTVGRRSERERIADRGATRLAQADVAIRSGNSPAFVAQLAAQANRDFKSAGGKVRASTESVAKGDANDLGGQLIKANETLKAIEKNLVPTTLGRRR